MFESIERSRRFAEDKLAKMRAGLSSEFERPAFGIVAVGSYGRAEASDESDIDWFVLDPDSTPTASDDPRYVRAKAVIAISGIKQPSPGGAFNGVQRWDEMLQDIGGEAEKNSQMTRRVLLMLESTWLLNESLRFRALRELMERYVRDDLRDDQIALFFLNDCIRYWRTICVDFEYKTTHQGKTWGDRSIKLRFSRKLLYFGGVAAAAQTWRMKPADKRARLCELLAQNPIDRVRCVFGAAADKALADYDWFLDRMSRRDVRDELIRVKREQASQAASEVYSQMKVRSHDFGRSLRGLLATLEPRHPIHEALTF